jgi:phosphate/sulfate permease
MIALTVLGALGMYWSFNEIAVGAITGIAASLNKLVERDD